MFGTKCRESMTELSAENAPRKRASCYGKGCCWYMMSDRVRGRRTWQVITEVSVDRDLILGDDARQNIAHMMLI